MMVTVQLPDGTLTPKHINALQPDDMVAFVGCPPVEYRPQPMDWDFGDGAQSPQDKTIVYLGGFDIASVTFEPMPGALDWSDA